MATVKKPAHTKQEVQREAARLAFEEVFSTPALLDKIECVAKNEYAIEVEPFGVPVWVVFKLIAKDHVGTESRPAFDAVGSAMEYADIMAEKAKAKAVK